MLQIKEVGLTVKTGHCFIPHVPKFTIHSHPIISPLSGVWSCKNFIKYKESMLISPWQNDLRPLKQTRCFWSQYPLWPGRILVSLDRLVSLWWFIVDLFMYHRGMTFRQSRRTSFSWFAVIGPWRFSWPFVMNYPYLLTVMAVSWQFLGFVPQLVQWNINEVRSFLDAFATRNTKMCPLPLQCQSVRPSDVRT